VTLRRHPEVVSLVLAAGQGTRMNSDLAKVLHPVAGQPMLAWVLATLDRLGVGRVLVAPRWSGWCRRSSAAPGTP